jgi:hypothetical protein
MLYMLTVNFIIMTLKSQGCDCADDVCQFIEIARYAVEYVISL